MSKSGQSRDYGNDHQAALAVEMYLAASDVDADHFAARCLITSQSETYASSTAELYKRLTASVNKLKGLYDEAAGWWLADQPPAISPLYTSVAEYVLAMGCRMLACLDCARPGGPEVVQRYLMLGTSDLARGADAALRCEATYLGNKPRPNWALPSLGIEETPGEEIWQQQLLAVSPPRYRGDWRPAKLDLDKIGWEELDDAQRMFALDRWEEHLRGPLSREPRPQGGDSSTACSVEISQKGKGPIVMAMGVVKRLKSPQMLELIRRLVEVCPYGLSYKEAMLIHTNASTVLNELCEDSDWSRVLELPGAGRSGYRIRTVNEVEQLKYS